MNTTTKIGLMAALMLLAVAAASPTATAWTRPISECATGVWVDPNETDVHVSVSDISVETGVYYQTGLRCIVEFADPL